MDQGCPLQNKLRLSPKLFEFNYSSATKYFTSILLNRTNRDKIVGNVPVNVVCVIYSMKLNKKNHEFVKSSFVKRSGTTCIDYRV